MTPHRWYEREEKLWELLHQPAILLDLLTADGANLHQLLKGTAVFPQDLRTGGAISSADLIKLVGNARLHDNSSELAFRWGQSLWPGHYGAFSQLLMGATNIAEFVQGLADYSHFLCPLLVPRVRFTEQDCCIEWLDGIGTGEQKPFLVQAYMTGVIAAVEWLAGGRVPWRAGLSARSLVPSELYLTYWGAVPELGVGLDVLLISREYWLKPWHSHRSQTTLTAQRRHQSQCAEFAVNVCPGFIFAVFSVLEQKPRDPPGLDATAQILGLSAATLKRKLREHGWSFQRLQDHARLHACVYKLGGDTATNEQLARYFNFNNATNFRRAFKRWLGDTPSQGRLAALRLFAKQTKTA